MQAQTVWHRVLESEELWVSLETLAGERGLPERTVNGIVRATLGLRVRRSSHQDETGLEYGAANRDLRALVERGLLEARGETRGRNDSGSRELRELYSSVRIKHRSRVVDPTKRPSLSRSSSTRNPRARRFSAQRCNELKIYSLCHRCLSE